MVYVRSLIVAIHPADNDRTRALSLFVGYQPLEENCSLHSTLYLASCGMSRKKTPAKQFVNGHSLFS